MFDKPVNDTSEDTHFNYTAYGIALTIAIFLGYIILVGLLSSLTPEKNLGTYKPLIMMAGQVLFMLLPAIFFSRRSPLRQQIYKFDKMPDPVIVLYTAGGILTLQIFFAGFADLQIYLLPDFLMDFYFKLQESMHEAINEVLGGKSISNLLLSLLSVAVAPAICEEKLFRGLCQRHLEASFRPLTAILITSFVFSLAHINPINFIQIMVIGIFLGYLAHFTKSLIAPAIAHFLNNAGAVIITYIYNDQLSNAETDINMHFAVALGLTLLGLGLTYLILKQIRHVTINHTENDPEPKISNPPAM